MNFILEGVKLGLKIPELLRTGSKVAVGTEEGLEKAAKPRLGKVCGCGEAGVAVFGGLFGPRPQGSSLMERALISIF